MYFPSAAAREPTMSCATARPPSTSHFSEEILRRYYLSARHISKTGRPLCSERACYFQRDKPRQRRPCFMKCIMKGREIILAVRGR